MKVIFPDTEMPCEDSSASATRVRPGDYVRVKVRDYLEVVVTFNCPVPRIFIQVWHSVALALASFRTLIGRLQ